MAVEATEDRAALTAGKEKEYRITVRNLSSQAEPFRINLDVAYESEAAEKSEWPVKVRGLPDGAWDPITTAVFERDLQLGANGELTVTLEVVAPRGSLYGDKSKVIFTVTSKDDPTKSDSKTFVTTAQQTVLAVKTSIGHEKVVADSIAARGGYADKRLGGIHVDETQLKKMGVFAILVPATLRGFVLVESMNPDKLQEISRGIRRARGLARGEAEIDFHEIEPYLTPKPIVSGIVEGDIVELTSGPFKGEKARVQHIDEQKEEITVELFEAVVPIPVTVKGDSVRVLDKTRLAEEGN